MTDQAGPQGPAQPESPPKPAVSTRLVVVFVVIALFAGVIAAKYLPPSQTGDVANQAPGGSLTSVLNDATADYEAAVATGKPIYVLFHSLS